MLELIAYSKGYVNSFIYFKTQENQVHQVQLANYDSYIFSNYPRVEGIKEAEQLIGKISPINID